MKKYRFMIAQPKFKKIIAINDKTSNV